MKLFKSVKIERRKLLGAIAFLLFLAFMLLVAWFIGRPMISFVESPQLFRKWVDEYGILGRLLFIGMVVFQVIIAIIPGEPLEFGAGYAFGAVEGTILTLIGILIGSLIVFALVKKFGMSFVEIFFSDEKISKINFLKKSRKRDLLIFIIFLIPGTPKDILSYFVGLTDMKYSTLIFISVVARFPSVVTSTISGSALGRESYILAVAVFVATLIISGFGLLIYNRICKNNIK